MKGTLYSADYIKTEFDGFKLLELNTDTDFPSASLMHFDWDPFIEQLDSASIDSVHIVHKPFQEYLVKNLKEALTAATTTFSVEETEETMETIYPTDVQDSATKFVLRMAYNEAAIFDSEYCSNGINLYKLYSDESSSNDIVPHYISSSAETYVNDTLIRSTNNSMIPDFAIKQGRFSTDGAQLEFYKLGDGVDGDTIEDRYTSIIASTYNDGEIWSTYYDSSEDTTTMHSYRSCNILFGSELNVVNVGMYKIKSWLEKPTNPLAMDNDVLLNKIENKHRYEFATNWPKEGWKNTTGVFGSSSLQDATDGTLVPAYGVSIGNTYKSLNIGGLPDVDDMTTVLSWSYDGDTLPTGTELTSSVLVSKESHSLDYGILSEISSSDDNTVMVGSGLPILVYDSTENKVRFELTSNIEAGRHQLFTASGSKLDVIENNIVVFENNETTYDLNMETEDTFLINNTGVFLVAHNSYGESGGTCFKAGTIISMGEEQPVKNIEDIVVGDIVSSWDEEEGIFTEGVVTEIDHRHKVVDHIDGCRELGYGNAGFFKIFLEEDGTDEGGNDLGLRFTPEHPFLTKDGWKALVPLVNQEPWAGGEEVKILGIGDELLMVDSREDTEDGHRYVKIRSIEMEFADEDETVYNFTVDGLHNYVAGSVVVHNK